MSLLLKVRWDGIMDEHIKTEKENGSVWYSYEGNPRAKPCEKIGLNDVYFIEKDRLYQGIILEKFKGPMQRGNDLNKNMISFIPEEFKEYIINNWKKYAFSLKVKNIKLLKTIPNLRKPIENMYYESNDKPFISTESGNGGAFFVYLRKKSDEYPENFIHVTKVLIDKAFDELEKDKALDSELISKLKEIVGRDDKVLVDDDTARSEIQKLMDERMD